MLRSSVGATRGESQLKRPHYQKPNCGKVQVKVNTWRTWNVRGDEDGKARDNPAGKGPKFRSFAEMRRNVRHAGLCRTLERKLWFVCGSEIALEVRFEVFTAVTMKNVVFWDIKPQSVLHRRHIMSPLQSTAS
jgi:hypothetical protein